MATQPKPRKSRLNKGELAKHYIIKEKLGAGNFATVRRVIRKTDKAVLAAKIISKKHLKRDELASLGDETEILRKMKHDHIVYLVQMFDTQKHLYLVMELCTGGELFDRIVNKSKSGKCYSEADASRVVGEVTDACAYMHKQGVAHRDLKPENLLYASPADDAPIKVTDFGLARFLHDGSGSRKANVMMTACGTPGYVAPEVLMQIGYDCQCDMWSIGVILYILLCGYPPFSAKRMKDLYSKIKKGDYSFPDKYWGNISKDAKSVVRLLLQVKSEKRITAEKLLTHPWINDPNMASPKAHNAQFHKMFRLTNLRWKLRRGINTILAVNALTSVLTATGLPAHPSNFGPLKKSVH